MPVLDSGDRVAGHATLRPRALVVLFKLRVVALLLVAALAGTFLAAAGWPGMQPVLLLVANGALASAGASAVNQYLERDSDARMVRTRTRPLVTAPAGSARRVAYLGLLMILVPPAVTLAYNPTLSLFVLLGAAIYLGVYTYWLKPRTPLNIVIGGAAGCVAVLSGSAAAGNWNAPGAVVLALIVFLWTPTHFWSLAIMYRPDYQGSNVPMLPARIAPRPAAGWVMLHTAATTGAVLLLATLPELGWLYLAPVAVASALFLRQGLRLVQRPTAGRAAALFKSSNLYLGLVLLLVIADSFI